MEYARVARKFVVGTGSRSEEYLGAVIASREALFLHLERHVMAGILGPPLGMIVPFQFGQAIADWFQSFSRSRARRIALTVSQLPAAIRDHPDWPIRSLDDLIVVVPRTAVAQLRISFMGGMIVSTKKNRFRIDFTAFTEFAGFDRLRRLGWRADHERPTAGDEV